MQTSEFNIPESISGIDLIVPGTALDSDPEIIVSNTPYFQWFGSLPEYKFTLYEVLEGQTSADEITSNLPVFETEELTTASYLYPLYAEGLIEGKTYAWQITSNLLTSSGMQQIFSDVYWFSFQKTDKSAVMPDNIDLSPDDVDLMPGDSIQIKVHGFDRNGDTLHVDCLWKVVPENLGQVSKDGWFIAGDKSGTVAVTVRCGALEDYITINIKKK